MKVSPALCVHQHSALQGFTVVFVAGADDFLPVLIWVVIKAQPPQLASNLEYIQRFRMASRFTAEFAYFYTQLVCFELKQDIITLCCSRPFTLLPSQRLGYNWWLWQATGSRFASDASALHSC